jgi:hypothetical protein
MKSYLLSVALILAVCVGCGGRTRPVSNAPAEADTTYTRIPGTRLSMIVPPAFEISPYGIGQLANDRGEEIVFLDIIGGNYYENAKNYTLESLGKLTTAPISFQKLEIAGYEASLARIEATAFGQGNMMLVFGDSTFCVSAVVIYNPGTSDHRRDILKNALLSVRYDPRIELDPTEIAPFTVTENDSGFEFDDYSMGTFVYRDRDRQKITTLSISMLPGVTVDELIEEQKRQLGFQEADQRALTLLDDGQELHELLLTGERSGEGLATVYVALVTDPGHRQSVVVLFPYFTASGRPGLEDKPVAGARAFARALKTDANENAN